LAASGQIAVATDTVTRWRTVSDMTSLWEALLIALIPAAGNIAGGLVAESCAS
jgi:hypothetical protein